MNPDDTLAMCLARHIYAASRTESGHVCTLGADHAAEHHDEFTGRRWSEPTTPVPNRRDRRAKARIVRRLTRALRRFDA